jgi:hypothetical protein
MDIPLEKDTTKIRPISGIPIATHPRVSPNPFRPLAGIRREPPGNPRKTRVHDPESTLSATPHGLLATFPTRVTIDSLGRIGSLQKIRCKSLLPMALGAEIVELSINFARSI